MMYRCKICSEHYLSTEALQDHQFASHTQEALEAFGITKQTVKVSQDWQTHSNESKAEILHSLGYTPSDIQTLISLEFYQFGSKVKKEIGEVLNKSTPVKQRAQAVESDENKTYQNMYDSYLQARSAQIKKPFQDGATEAKASEYNNPNIEWTGDDYHTSEWSCKICGETGDNLNFGATISNIEDHLKTHGIGEAKASEEASEDCPKCGHGKNTHSSPASGDTICYGSSDCTCGMTFPTEGESKASEKEELLSDIIAKINKKYGGDEEQEEEGEGFDPSTGVTTSIHGGTWDTDEDEAIARAKWNPTNKCGMCNKTFDSVQELKDHSRASGVHYPTGESKASEEFKEEDHPRASDGKFGSGKSGNKKTVQLYRPEEELGSTVMDVIKNGDKDGVLKQWMKDEAENPEQKSVIDMIKKEFEKRGMSIGESKANEALKSHTDYHKLINSTLSGETNIQCSKCSKKFKGQESLNIHYNDSHADNELKSLIGELRSHDEEQKYLDGVIEDWAMKDIYADQAPESKASEEIEYTGGDFCDKCGTEFEDKGECKKCNAQGEAMVEDIIHKTDSGVDITHSQDEWCELCDKPTTSFEVSDDEYDEKVEDLMEEEGVDEITDFDEEEKKDFFEDVDDIKTTDEEQTEDGEAVGLSSNWDDDEKRMDGGDVPQVEEDPYKDYYTGDARDQMQNDIKDLSNPNDITTDIKGKPWQDGLESLTEEQELQQARESLAPLNKLDDEKSNVTKAFESGASAEDIYSKVGDTTQDRGSEDDLTDIYNKVDVKLNLEKV